MKEGRLIGRRTLALLLIGFSILLSIILMVVGDLSMEPSQIEGDFTLTVEGGGLILSDGSMLRLDSGVPVISVETLEVKRFEFKVLDGEGFGRAWERMMVQVGVSSTGSPVYVGAFRFGGLSPDVGPGTNYVGWFEIGGERFEFIYNMTIQSTETIPISGTVPVGWGVPHGNWDMIARISAYLSWQPAAQTIGISLIDNIVKSGDGQLVRGGSASVSFTPPYDYRHPHSIVIMNFGPSIVSYRGTVWVTHRS